MIKKKNSEHVSAPLEGTVNFACRDGKAMLTFIRGLLPICRSITGNGVRQTLAIIHRYVPEL